MKNKPQREATKAEEILFKRLIKRIVKEIKANKYPIITKYIKERNETTAKQ